MGLFSLDLTINAYKYAYIFLGLLQVYLSDILVSLICLIKIDIRYVTIPISLCNKIICVMFQAFGAFKIFEANPSRRTQKAHTH